VPYAAVPDWQNSLRVQVGGLQAADVDVVTANQGNSSQDPYRPMYMYVNSGGVLENNPSWQSAETSIRNFLDLGDLDGDGWQDLALGHDPTLLYTNDGVVLSATWSSAATYFGHSDLRWCDVDGDGDPDLAEVHFSNGQTHIYLNRDGALDAAPSWSYDSSSVGTAVAFGDINGDSLPTSRSATRASPRWWCSTTRSRPCRLPMGSSRAT
jgi:hypothetical protein